MISRILYLTLFLTGLALGVHVMLHGGDRWRRRRSHRPSAAFNPPTVSALALGIGAAGYLLSTRSGLGRLTVFFVALCIGAAGFVGMTVLMAKWALRDAAPGLSEEEDVNGQIATVTREIRADSPGEISWYAWDQLHTMPAVAVSDMDIAPGSEVVIDVVADGVARVELWSVVESRL